MDADTFRQSFTQGYGEDEYLGGWISSVTVLGAAEATKDGPVAGSPDAFVVDSEGDDAEIDLTGQRNAADNRVNLFVRLANATDHDAYEAAASATVAMYFQPEGESYYIFVDTYATEHFTGGMWTIKNMQPGTYKFGIDAVSADTRVQILYAATA